MLDDVRRWAVVAGDDAVEAGAMLMSRSSPTREDSFGMDAWELALDPDYRPGA